MSDITNSVVAVSTPDGGNTTVEGVINFKGTEYVAGNITNAGLINVLPLDTPDATPLVVNVGGQTYTLSNGAKLFSGNITNTGTIQQLQLICI